MSQTIFSIERGAEDELLLRFKPVVPRVLPATAKTHLRIAGKEGLLVFRSLIDEAISAIEREEKKQEGRVEVKVE
jgi:hypothetical protein